MIEELADIPGAEAPMETFVCRPERGGPHPVILFLMDAPGIREELHDMTRRLASAGYFVLLPNLYYRAGRDTKFGPDVLEAGSADHTRMRAIRTKMTIGPVMEDVQRLLEYVDARPEADGARIGCHGYCLSGPFAIAAAACFPERIGAAASLYGTWLVDEGEPVPRPDFAPVRGELYLGCAEHDVRAPLPLVEELRESFQASGARGEIEIYPHVHHGFAFPERWCYDRVAAERHWERLHALYRRLG